MRTVAEQQGVDHEICRGNAEVRVSGRGGFASRGSGHKCGVLHIHNLQETVKRKGVDFPNAGQILEICNPQRAKEVLTEDMDLNMALTCRVSVYSECG